MVSKNSRRLAPSLRIRRTLRWSTRMRIATFNSASEKKRRLRILRNGRATNPDRSGDHPIARPTGILQAKNFSNLPHRQSLGGHRTSHCVNRQRRTLPRSDCRQRSPSHPINRVAAFLGLGGSFPPESSAPFRRKRLPLSSEFPTPQPHTCASTPP